MTTQEAIKQLQTEHDLIAGERDLDGSQFAPALLEALAMAIEALKAQDMTLYMNLPEVSAEEAVEILKRNNRIELLPSAQPETHGKRTETHGVCLDVISRQDAIDLWDKYHPYIATKAMAYDRELRALQPVQPDNQIHLCDSCEYNYPDCPSKPDDVIFGNGKGNDNICACNKYRPISAQPERKTGHWIPYDQRFPWSNDYKCSECGNYFNFSDLNGGRGDANFCPSCGADMRGEQDE